MGCGFACVALFIGALGLCFGISYSVFRAFFAFGVGVVWFVVRVLSVKTFCLVGVDVCQWYLRVSCWFGMVVNSGCLFEVLCWI